MASRDEEVSSNYQPVQKTDEQRYKRRYKTLKKIVGDLSDESNLLALKVARIQQRIYNHYVREHGQPPPPIQLPENASWRPLAQNAAAQWEALTARSAALLNDYPSASTLESTLIPPVHPDTDDLGFKPHLSTTIGINDPEPHTKHSIQDHDDDVYQAQRDEIDSEIRFRDPTSSSPFDSRIGGYVQSPGGGRGQKRPRDEVSNDELGEYDEERLRHSEGEGDRDGDDEADEEDEEEEDIFTSHDEQHGSGRREGGGAEG